MEEKPATIQITKPFTTMINATFDALDAEIIEKKQQAARKSKEEAEKIKKELQEKINKKQQESSEEIDKKNSAEEISTAKKALDAAIEVISGIGGSLEDLAKLPAKITEALNSISSIVQQIAVVPMAMIEDAATAPTTLISRASQSKDLMADWPSTSNATATAVQENQQENA